MPRPDNPLRVLASNYVAGTKTLIHYVQIALANGDVAIQWMSNEELNQWRLRLYGHTIEDGVANLF